MQRVLERRLETTEQHGQQTNNGIFPRTSGLQTEIQVRSGCRLEMEELGGRSIKPTGARGCATVLGIPSFDRNRPKWWVRQCERAFYQHHIDEVIKVYVAATYLEGVSYVWFQNWSWGRIRLSWPQFVIDLCNRFGEPFSAYVINKAAKLAIPVVQEADKEAKEAEEGIEEMGNGSPMVGSISSTTNAVEFFPVCGSQKQQDIEDKDLENGSPLAHEAGKVAVEEEEEVSEVEDLEDGSPLAGSPSSTSTGAETFHVFGSQRQQMKELKMCLYQVIGEREVDIQAADAKHETGVVKTREILATTKAEKPELNRVTAEGFAVFHIEADQFLVLPRMRWQVVVDISVVAAEAKERRKHKQKEKGDKKKEKRRRLLWVKIGIG